MAIDLTAGGRLHVHPLVDERKVSAFSEMLDRSLRGDRMETARMQETLSSSDAVFSLAQLINIRNLPAYDEAPRQGNKIASPFTVNDFKPATFYSLEANFDNLKYGKGTGGNVGVAPRVAELDTYPYAYGYSEENAKVAIEKRGFKWGVSLENVVNDPTGQIRQVPGDMLQIGLDTEEFLIFRALIDGSTSASHLLGGTVQTTGAVIPANAPISADAFRQGFVEIAKRVDIHGRQIPLASSYYVVVPLGYADQVELELAKARSLVQVTQGNFIFGPGSVPLGALGRITGVIETEWVTVSGSNVPWYLVPAAGTTRRTSLINLNLAGYTAPEVYVSNFNGIPIAGGASSDPFRAFSFDNDAIDLKFRMFTNAALISEAQQVWSSGAGA
jgi:hypothetical protein